MEWFINILTSPGSIAHLVVLYAIVISLGVKLGKIKFGGVALGVTFVLFMGIVAGHLFNYFGGIDHAEQKATIDFVKELGLILFVYCIGLQVTFIYEFLFKDLGEVLLLAGGWGCPTVF